MSLILKDFPKSEDFTEIFAPILGGTIHSAVFAALAVLENDPSKKVAVSYSDWIMPGIYGSEFTVLVPMHPRMDFDSFSKMASLLGNAKVKQDLIDTDRSDHRFLLEVNRSHPLYMYNYELVFDKGQTKERFKSEIKTELAQAANYFNSLDNKAAKGDPAPASDGRLLPELKKAGDPNLETCGL